MTSQEQNLSIVHVLSVIDLLFKRDFANVIVYTQILRKKIMHFPCAWKLVTCFYIRYRFYICYKLLLLHLCVTHTRMWVSPLVNIHCYTSVWNIQFAKNITFDSFYEVLRGF